MKDIAEYLINSFIDYKGEEHNVVICALSQTPEQGGDYNLMVCWSDGDTVDSSEDIFHDVYRAVSIGIAIHNPVDKFDVAIGKKIALNRALKSDHPKFVSLDVGVVNSPLIRAYLHQEMQYVIANPEKFIPGYEEAKKRWEKHVALKKEVKSLNEKEKIVLEYATEGVDVIKCAKLAKDLLDQRLRETNN